MMRIMNTFQMHFFLKSELIQFNKFLLNECNHSNPLDSPSFLFPVIIKI